MDWEKAISRLGSGIDFSRIPKAVAERLRNESSIGVACSGGADSVFALLLVYLFLEKESDSGKLSVLHFDHALRGEESEGDALFVRTLADSLGIPFLDARAEWPDASGRVSEAMAREARLDFFERVCKRAAGKSYIVTGHHADDVVETVLMRLSRGAGLRGLCVPRELSEARGGLVFLRPILDWGRDEVRAQLAASGVPWREDSTNFSDGNYRARLRKSAITSWEEAADRPIRPGVCRSRRLLEEDAEALESWAEVLWRELWSERERALGRKGLAALPVAMQRRVLSRLPGSPGASLLEEALNLLASGSEGIVEARRGLFYKFGEKWVGLVERDDRSRLDWDAFVLPMGTVAYLPDGARVSASWVRDDGSMAEKLGSGRNNDGKLVYLSPVGNSLEGLWVRLRQPGDAFKPHGKSSPKKLKDLFIERKIERRERDRLPVFFEDMSGIVWVPGLPPNADCLLSAGAEAALRLTYDR